MSISLNIVGQRIVTQRKKLKLTQIQLAEKVGISERTLGKVENGFDMRLSMLLAISDALNMDVARLLSNNGDSDTNLDSNKQQILEHLDAIRLLIDK